MSSTPAPAAPPVSPTPSATHAKKKQNNPVLAGVLAGVGTSVVLIGILITLLLTNPSLFNLRTLDNGSLNASSGSSITITPSEDDVTTAQAVAAKALPSVVSIYCTTASGEAMGSGVILDENGNIITNNHVIEDATAISVTANNKSYTATLVGTDASSDLAVLHVDFGDDEITPVEVGDSSQLVAGSWVMSVGSPFGLEQSVSQGIVSALFRSEILSSSSGNSIYANLIQVDAAINPGNSGGALVNDQGQLVGICTLFSSDTESFAGIGFAIPGNYAVNIAEQIIAGEQVTHAYIGLSMQTVNAQNAQANNLSVSQGAYVAEVAADGPAEAAGIKQGDIITAIDNTEITSADAVILAVRSHDIGDTVQVTVRRGNEDITVSVTLGSDEKLQSLQEQQLQQEQQNQQNTTQDNSKGITLEDLEEWYRQRMQQQQPNNNNGLL